MFEEFTLIPHTEAEAIQTMDTFSTIANKFRDVTDNDKVRLNWNGNYLIQEVIRVLLYLNAIDNENPYEIQYHVNNSYRFKQRAAKEIESEGIFINEEASTHFTYADYPGAKYMESAQEFLKINPRHFLKIFTSPNNKILYIWTNKELPLDTLYKLFSLEKKINKRSNEYLDKFLNAFINTNDVEKARQILINFFTSDRITELEYQKFKKCLVSTTDKKIHDLEELISTNRQTIDRYEREIVNLATAIREQNERIAFLRNTSVDDEDNKLFYKHLKKIPYITSFSGSPNGYIELHYEAPLIYFSDLPAEKMLNQNFTETFSKKVIKIMLGRKYELWSKCYMRFYTSNFAVDLYHERSGSNILPHPHIDRYGCFGNHRQAIHQSAEAGDYIGGIEQLTQAVLNVNFYDGCVINEMIRTLKNNADSMPTWKCLETGEMLTTTQVIERGDYYEET